MRRLGLQRANGIVAVSLGMPDVNLPAAKVQEVCSRIAVEIAGVPDTAPHAVTRPWSKRTNAEAAVSVGGPRVNVVVWREVNQVRLPVPVEVTGLP